MKVSYVACTDCENDKTQLTSHSNYVNISYISYTDCENNKIRLTSHSNFVNVPYISCPDCEDDKISHVCDSERKPYWQLMYIAKMKQGKRGLDKEKEVTDLEEKN